jgi:hypothetical protein
LDQHSARPVQSLQKRRFTFLPRFSPPYTHYSLIARADALWHYFVEGRSWEAAAPVVQDPNRVPDPSTLRRWFQCLDISQPPFSFLRRTMGAISRWLSDGEILRHGSLLLHRQTLFSFLQCFWPLRL